MLGVVREEDTQVEIGKGHGNFMFNFFEESPYNINFEHQHKLPGFTL